MNKERKIRRWWQYKINGDTFRAWSIEEYKTQDPHLHMFEKRWFVFYPEWTGRLPLPCNSKKEAKRIARDYENSNCNLPHHKAQIIYADCEFVCGEFKEVFCENMNVWIPKKEIY